MAEFKYHPSCVYALSNAAIGNRLFNTLSRLYNQHLCTINNNQQNIITSGGYCPDV